MGNYDDSLTPPHDIPKQQFRDVEFQAPIRDGVRISTSRPTEPLATDPTHVPVDPHRDIETDLDLFKKEKHQSASESGSRLGEVVEIRNVVRGPANAVLATKKKKKLNTTQAVIIFITNEVGIGLLSLPSALKTLGFFPGILLIVVMGMLSLYTAYNLVQYWRRYPFVLNIVDYGRVLGGQWLEAIFAVAFLINMAFICAAAILTVSTGLNTISEHATCTVVWTAVGVVAMWAMCIPHSMRFVSWASWPCTISIIATVMIVMITLAVEGPRNPNAPLNLRAIGKPSFTEATSAFLNIAFAYTGNQAFPTVLVEMENPSRDFPRAITIEKCFTTAIYTIVATVVYALSGEQVTSPAIGSVRNTMAKVSYGVAFVGLLGTGLIFGMTAARYLSVFFKRNIQFLKTHTPQSKSYSVRRASLVSNSSYGRHSSLVVPKTSKTAEWAIWLLSVTLFWVLVFILANAIPVFNSLLNISSSLLLSWLTWGVTVLFWFHLNQNGRWRSSGKKMALAALNILILAMVLFMTVPGMYASIDALLLVFADPNQTVNGPFTCADTSVL